MILQSTSLRSRMLRWCAWAVVGAACWLGLQSSLGAGGGAPQPVAGAEPEVPGGGRFTRLTTDDGLPTNDIRSIAQDHEGFIWLGTADAGLCRFDGYEVRRFVNDPDEPASLSHNFVWTLLVDRAGTVWVGTAGGGLDRYDPQTGTFHHHQHAPGDPASLPHNTVLSLFEDSAGTLWVGTRAGLSRFDRGTGRFTNYARPADDRIGANLNSVRCMAEDPASGLLWLGTSDSLCAFDPATGVFTTVLRPAGDFVPTGYNSVNSVIKDPDGVFWIGTERGFLRFRPAADLLRTGAGGIIEGDFDLFTHCPGDATAVPSEYIRDARLDRRGRLWLATQNGLALFDRGTGRCRIFRHHPGDPQSIGADLCHRVFEDNAGNIWVTSQHGGVSRLNAWAKEFRNFRRVLGDANTLCHDMVTALLVAEDGALWVGTVEGLSRSDSSGWRSWRHDPNDPSSLSADGITAIAQDAAGRIWIATGTGGLNRLEADGRFTRFLRRPGDPEPADLAVLPYTHNQVSSLLPAQGGGLWVGARAWGLDFFEGGSFLHRATTDAAGRRQPVDFAAFGHETADGTLFFGTEQWGLVGLDRRSGALTAHLPDPGNPASPLNKYITTVYSDGGDSLWVGSINGLFEFSIGAGAFKKHLTRRDGLPADAVVSMVADRTGMLWVGTGAGLAQVDPVRGAVLQVFDRTDGLPSNQLVPRAAVRDAEGRVYFGTSAGLTSFDPSRLARNELPPPTVITGLELVGLAGVSAERAAALAQGHGSGPIRLGPGRTGITVRFAALDFTAPARNRYRYRLEGYDRDWRETVATERHATYANLPPGQYVFLVVGSNNDGAWSVRPARLEIEVRRVWWATTWFRAGLAAALLLAVVGGYRLRVRAIARHSALLERQVAERTRELEIARVQAETASRAKSTFLATMSHELRTPLNSVLGYTQRLLRDPTLDARQAETLRTIRQSGEHLLTLINDVLDLSRAVAGRLELVTEDFDLPRFLRGISDIIRVRIEEKGLKFAVEVDADLPRIVRGDATRLRQVLLNLLGNAVRFTDHGVVSLRVRRGTGAPVGRIRLGFEVEDTGIGMEPEQVARLFRPFEQVADERHREGGAGLGLAISRQLVELMGGRITVTSAAGRGSRFSFEIVLPCVGGCEPAGEEAGAVVGYTGARRTILIVDAAAPRRAALADSLQALDFRVIESDALPPDQARVERAAADLAIVAADGVVPVAPPHAADESVAAMPIIVLADRPAPAPRTSGERDRWVAWLERPIEMPLLLAHIGRTLGLAWVRQAQVVGSDVDHGARASTPFAAPPAAEVEALWALALRGDMRGIRNQADHLASLGPEHRPLAEHLKSLASDYKSRAILATIRQFGRLDQRP